MESHTSGVASICISLPLTIKLSYITEREAVEDIATGPHMRQQQRHIVKDFLIMVPPIYMHTIVLVLVCIIYKMLPGYIPMIRTQIV